jgi:glycosyltransferase involved in cell wall biosynthesis
MNICLVGGIFDRPEAVRSKQLVTPETVLLDGFRKAGVTVHAVGHARFQPSDDYDIIHVHHFGRAALKMASSRCRARVVFTGHNGLIPTGWERSRLRRYAFQYVVDKAEAFVALSRAEARYYAGVTSADKIHTIPNGVPADVFRAAGQRRKRADKERYDVLYVGQLIDWKGVDFLLEATQRLRGAGSGAQTADRGPGYREGRGVRGHSRSAGARRGVSSGGPAGAAELR